jgi:hypothetical protein
MYAVENKKVGAHLGNLIKRKFKSDREFALEYLRRRGFDEDGLQNMQNKISQIKNGNKGVQIEDLPFFAELLDVSVDDILSAGEFIAPAPKRQTNYSAAYSNDKKVWEEYVRRPDKPFLNPDEYNKTIIDYALEAGNYSMLKYLTDNGYIFFIDESKNDIGLGFGAGTTIKRREPGFTDALDTLMKERDDLRLGMIALAVKNGDRAMLEKLRAREFPFLYLINHVKHRALSGVDLALTGGVDRMLSDISSVGDDQTVAYFFEDFGVASEFSSHENTFIFPYAGALLDKMIARIGEKAIPYLKSVLRHDRAVLDKLTKSVEDSLEACEEYYAETIGGGNTSLPSAEYLQHEAEKTALSKYAFYSASGFVAFAYPACYAPAPFSGFISNVVRVSVKCRDAETKKLIDELNGIYDEFIKLAQRKEACENELI